MAYAYTQLVQCHGLGIVPISFLGAPVDVALPQGSEA